MVEIGEDLWRGHDICVHESAGIHPLFCSAYKNLIPTVGRAGQDACLSIERSD